MDAKYWTTLQNKRQTQVVVTSPDGTAIVIVPPGKSHRICSWDPAFLYARFSRVMYLPGNRVAVDFNSDWRNPWEAEGRHCIELLNLTKPDQNIKIDGELRTALPGLPTLVPISTNDPLIEFEKITWMLVTHKYPSEADPRYVEKVTRVEQVRELRSRKEMKAIKKAIVLEEEAKLKATLDKRFPSLRGPNETA